MLKERVIESPSDLPSSKMLRKNKLDSVRFFAVATIQLSLVIPDAFSSQRNRVLEGNQVTARVSTYE